MFLVEGGTKLVLELRERQKRWSSAAAEVGFFDRESASKAFENEYGHISSDKKQFVPPRPFMRLSVKDYKRTRSFALVNALRSGKTGKEAVEAASEALKQFVLGVIIAGNRVSKNALYTVTKKGFDHPLIETGGMLKAVARRMVKVRP